ncbi:putative cytosolic Cu/Zn superoxide dismutase [Aspergillus novofumigatus IBT 16806]|uniref:Putative cytosolic Cu/Zn superoxide dismutase n=1 Tax=Aspergillus novofumigatus (strain IBT 16806) TaxID=1392255 RepID=A0A2I1C993_ASPN1|nr:putative cytosolic Cu/Zn superoxide dismutase [Aspergillus novofumigatus IBT 16806]PKX94208.1 putative cytosolic Cu/Zn superoxide dismutase [Aspergillus novofumigatus IBT 16806]
MQSILTTLVLLGLSVSSTAVAVSPNGTFAPVVTNDNDTGDVLYEATLPHRQNTTLRGWITLFAPRDGDGVKVHADFWGIPDNEALAYYIHEGTVPADGNCYRTGNPFDPYGRGDKAACNMTSPQTCQIGDLSGKHGPIVTADHQGFEARYNDLYLSTKPGEPAYFGNRSIVVHRMSDHERLSCANFVLVARPGLLPVALKN